MKRKRLVMRFAMLGVVAVAGVAAIVQSQMTSSNDTNKEQAKAEDASPAETADGAPQPIPFKPEQADAVAEPAPRGQLLTPSEPQIVSPAQFASPAPEPAPTPSFAASDQDAAPPDDRFGGDDRFQPQPAEPAEPYADQAGPSVLGAPVEPDSPLPVDEPSQFSESAEGLPSEPVEPAAADTMQPELELDDRFAQDAPATLDAAEPALDSQFGAAPVEPAPVEQAPVGAAAQQPPATLTLNDTPTSEPLPQPSLPGFAEQTAPEPSALGQDVAAGGQPGSPELEGPQTPALTLEKIVPDEIQVNREATFTVRVRNTGQVPARQVQVRDQVPQGTRLVQTLPKATQSPGGGLVWQFDQIKPGETVEASMTLLPLAEGEIGSVATVAFEAMASARTVCTKPQLVLEATIPDHVLIGERLPVSITVRNTGSGAASSVVLEADVPDGLSHPAGRELEYEIGSLGPDQSRQLELELTAEEAGAVLAQLNIHADGNLATSKTIETEVVAPQLQVGIAGPRLRYLEREATYSISIANPGTAAASDVELVAYLPKGLEFLNTNNAGQYDPRTHAVFWNLEQLPAEQTGTVQLTAVPKQTGQQKLRIESTAQMGLSASEEKEVVVEGLAELFFQITDSADPIEVQGRTTYEVRVVNEGSETATNVRLDAMLPAEMEALGAEGPTEAKSNGQVVQFAPLARLEPKGEAVYKIEVQGNGAGDHRIRVQLASDESTAPVIKEESTRVYADR